MYERCVVRRGGADDDAVHGLVTQHLADLARHLGTLVSIEEESHSEERRGEESRW